MDGTYWDSDEYDFFDSLNDDVKLIYLYELLSDYCSDRFTDWDDSDDDDDWADESEDVEPKSESKNLVVISGMDSIKLTGESIDVIEDIARMIMINGVMLSNEKVDHLSDGNVSVQYKIVGKTKPICLN